MNFRELVGCINEDKIEKELKKVKSVLKKNKNKIVRDIKASGITDKEDILQMLRDEAGEYTDEPVDNNTTDWEDDRDRWLDVLIDFANKTYKEEFINEKTAQYKKGKEYKIEFEDESTFGKFIGTGKGRLSPNKGKDVYIFKAVIDEDDYKDGKIKVGFWEVEQNRTKIIEVV